MSKAKELYREFLVIVLEYLHRHYWDTFAFCTSHVKYRTKFTLKERFLFWLYKSLIKKNPEWRKEYYDLYVRFHNSIQRYGFKKIENSH